MKSEEKNGVNGGNGGNGVTGISIIMGSTSSSNGSGNGSGTGSAPPAYDAVDGVEGHTNYGLDLVEMGPTATDSPENASDEYDYAGSSNHLALIKGYRMQY